MFCDCGHVDCPCYDKGVDDGYADGTSSAGDYWHLYDKLRASNSLPDRLQINMESLLLALAQNKLEYLMDEIINSRGDGWT